ncbi:MAG: hypothetical protein MRK02_03435 [Candidatus Scalindua sp.]|nr:hypothetical protein [Candidatus Scalindua sp.]
MSVISLRYLSRFELITVPMFVVAITAVYPNIFPIAAIVLVGLIATLVIKNFDLSQSIERKTLVKLLLVSGITLIVCAGILKVYAIDTTESIIALSSFKASAKKTVAAGLSLTPFGIAMLWTWRSKLPEDRGFLLILGTAFIGSIFLNILMRLGALNEYKFFFTAGISIIAPAMVGVERVLLKTNKSRWVLLGILLPLLAGVMLSYAIRRIPKDGSEYLEVQENSFWLTLASSNPDSDWTKLIRTETPVNTILVVNHPEFHTTSFTGRTLLAPSEGEKYHFGYNMSSRTNLVKLRGYSKQLFESRYDLLHSIYSSTLSTKMMNTVLKQLKSFQRPLAIVFGPNDERLFLHWLKKLNVGFELFNDNEERIVYFIP